MSRVKKIQEIAINAQTKAINWKILILENSEKYH